jgi:hypothetical protein
MITVDLLAFTQTVLLHDTPLARRPCATGCCTSPPGSPADNVGSATHRPTPAPPCRVSARCPPHRLTAKPDTTSGGSHRQKQQAGHLAMPAHTEQCRQRSTTASKISQLTRE